MKTYKYYNYWIKNCEMCWAEMKNIWNRKYCSKCRKIRDDQLEQEKNEKQKAIRANDLSTK